MSGTIAKRVFLHIGAGKTGTSKIQAALSALRPDLADSGVFYPLGYGSTDDQAEKGKVSSGNGVALATWLNPNVAIIPVDKRGQIRSWLQGCIHDAAGRDLLFSSEVMQSARPAETAELCKLFVEAGYLPIVIMYVRHALDQAISIYLQHLKRGFATLRNRDEVTDLGSFLRTHSCGYMATLRPFAAILPPEQINVRLYDAEQDALVQRFLKLLSDRTFDIPSPDAILNRSPTAAEQVVFHTLAMRPNGRRLCILAADLMLNRKSSTREQTSVSPADLSVFAARNQRVVNEINSLYLGNTGTLLLKSDRIAIGEEVAPPDKAVLAAFAECFALLAERLARP